jgi:isopenicillin-N epimerase
MQFDEAHWNKCKDLISRDERIINLNAGTLSPTPLALVKRIRELRQMMESNPSDFFWRQAEPLIERSRASLAKYVNCNSRDLLLLPNVTNALNIAIGSIQLPAGSEILVTNHEYGAILNAWKVRASEKSWTIRTFDLPDMSEDPMEYVRAMQHAVSPQTRVLFFSHVVFTTGLTLPAAALCKAARKMNLLTVIDGAHAPGGTKVDLSDIGADFYGANLHKWVMCPAGAGFLFADQKHHQSLKPVVTSWGYPYDFEKAYEPSGAGGSRFQWSLEYQGVMDRTPQMVVPEAIAFRESLGGEEAIFDRVRELGDYALATIGQILKPAIPRNYDLRGPMVSFEFPQTNGVKCDPIAVRDRFYTEFNIECPATLVGERCFLRVSTAWFNIREEIVALRKAIVSRLSS